MSIGRWMDKEDVACTWASRAVLVVKNPPASSGDIGNTGSVPGSGRCPGGGHGNPLQYSCLESPRDRGTWQPTVRGVTRVGHDSEKTTNVYLFYFQFVVIKNKAVINIFISTWNVRDLGPIPGLGRSPGDGNGNPLQYSGLENSMDREACWATVHGVTKSRT